jgi:hypothetical protein
MRPPHGKVHAQVVSVHETCSRTARAAGFDACNALHLTNRVECEAGGDRSTLFLAAGFACCAVCLTKPKSFQGISLAFALHGGWWHMFSVMRCCTEGVLKPHTGRGAGLVDQTRHLRAFMPLVVAAGVVVVVGWWWWCWRGGGMVG